MLLAFCALGWAQLVIYAKIQIIILVVDAKNLLTGSKVKILLTFIEIGKNFFILNNRHIYNFTKNQIDKIQIILLNDYLKLTFLKFVVKIVKIVISLKFATKGS